MEYGLTKEQMEKILFEMPGHAPVAHDFKSLRETGYRSKCFRCRFLNGHRGVIRKAVATYLKEPRREE